jgi:SAM-dependent methyltransferase
MIDRNLNYGRHQIRRFLEDAAPFSRVLDIGAGNGGDLESARAVVPTARLQALEVNPPYIRNLREKGFETVQFDLESAPFPIEDGALDVIIANQILEHVKEVFWIFHEISRTLRIGGRFIMGVPNLASLHNRLLLMAGRQPTVIATASAHVRGYTRTDVLRFLEACFPGGYVLRGFGGSNFYPFPPVIARPLAALLPSMAWGIFFSFEKVREYDGGFLRFPGKNLLETSFYVGDRREDADPPSPTANR